MAGLVAEMALAGVPPTRGLYSDAIKGVDPQGQWQHAVHLLHEFKRRQAELDVLLYTVLTKACQKGQAYEKALEAYADMRQAGVVPRTNAPYQAPLLIAGNLGRWQLVGEIFGHMHDASVSPETLTFATGMQVYSQCGLWHQVLDMVEEMRRLNVRPHGGMNIRRLIDEAAAMVQSTESEKVAKAGRKMISARPKDWQIQLAALSEKREQRLVWISHYHKIMAACNKDGQWRFVLEFMTELREQQLGGELISFVAGLKACAQANRWEQMLCVLNDMLR